MESRKVLITNLKKIFWKYSDSKRRVIVHRRYTLVHFLRHDWWWVRWWRWMTMRMTEMIWFRIWWVRWWGWQLFRVDDAHLEKMKLWVLSFSLAFPHICCKEYPSWDSAQFPHALFQRRNYDNFKICHLHKTDLSSNRFILITPLFFLLFSSIPTSSTTKYSVFFLISVGGATQFLFAWNATSWLTLSTGEGLEDVEVVGREPVDGLARWLRGR